jgi:hypothetical protein
MEGTVTAKVLSPRKRRKTREEKASRSENEHYLLRIKSAQGGIEFQSVNPIDSYISYVFTISIFGE